MKKVFIQYKIKPDQVSNVKALIKKVFDDLRTASPDRISYSAQKLGDGQTFIHTYIADENAKNPVVSLSSFKELQEYLKFNHVEKPVSITPIIAFLSYPNGTDAKYPPLTDILNCPQLKEGIRIASSRISFSCC